MKTNFLNTLSRTTSGCLAALTLIPAIAGSAETIFDLPPLTVIAQPGAVPLMTEIDPNAPAQPIPAQDGADMLKTMAGFNVIRKGGTSGDPIMRGMAGSRLGILLDGENILGGCGNRMDPPTAYVFPSTYDQVTVLKGPQSVLHGPGNSAGVVLFERLPRYYAEPEFAGRASLTVGSWARNDQLLDLKYGSPAGFAGIHGNRTASGDYEDGDGSTVHSQYERWNLKSTLGWTPDETTVLELTGSLSDGEAAYADRMMDGTEFARRHLGMRFHQRDLSDALESIEANLFVNYVDHVMDNFSLRPFTATPMMPHPMVSNPDRLTYGGRLTLTMVPNASTRISAGADYQANEHTARRSHRESMQSYRTKPRMRTARFEAAGLFAEVTRTLYQRSRLVGGVRADFWQARDDRDEVMTGMMGAHPNPTAGERRSEVLPSGFMRYERDFDDATKAYVGIGHAQRFPDYWELFGKESVATVSAFGMDPERTTQLDTGVIHHSGALNLSVSAFVNRIDDFILIETGYAKPSAMSGIRHATVSRNIHASTYGGELSLVYDLTEQWRMDASLAYVRGYNHSDGRPLAQQPPLEGRFGLSYTQNRLSVGALVRGVAAQKRIALNQGNIVGQDLGESPGFAVASINASWALGDNSRLMAGIDNLFDRSYAEHLSRGGSMVAGFPPPTTRVNEPGRTLWLKWDGSF